MVALVNYAAIREEVVTSGCYTVVTRSLYWLVCWDQGNDTVSFNELFAVANSVMGGALPWLPVGNTGR